MATKYRILGKAQRTRKKTGYGYRIQDLGRYDVPIEVVGLVEDMMRLSIVAACMREIDTRSITVADTQEQRDYGDLMLRSQLTLVRSWQRYAKRKLQKYLAP